MAYTVVENSPPPIPGRGGYSTNGAKLRFKNLCRLIRVPGPEEPYLSLLRSMVLFFLKSLTFAMHVLLSCTIISHYLAELFIGQHCF